MRALLFAMFTIATLLSAAGPAAAGPQTFTIYDNMFYFGKPSAADCGLIAANIIYGTDIWPAYRNYGELPRHEAYATVVAEHSAGAGPIVIDIERLPFAGSRRTARHRLRVLATLADWTHALAPGRIVGYFGYNVLTDVKPRFRDLAHELARHVDAFFPAMYARNDDRAAWMRRAEQVVRQYRAYSPDKPIYFYLWPQYDAHTPKQFQWIDRDYWRFQLETSRRLAAGAVIWGTRYFPWNVSSGWWEATRGFMRRNGPAAALPGIAEAGPAVR